jgi:hypothetical protein
VLVRKGQVVGIYEPVQSYPNCVLSADRNAEKCSWEQIVSEKVTHLSDTELEQLLGV